MEGSADCEYPSLAVSLFEELQHSAVQTNLAHVLLVPPQMVVYYHALMNSDGLLDKVRFYQDM